MMERLGMIRCEEAMGKLWEFLDGALSEDEEVALKKHLEICNRCFPAYDFQRAYLEYTRRLATKEPTPPGVRRRLFTKLLAQEAAAEGT